MDSFAKYHTHLAQLLQEGKFPSTWNQELVTLLQSSVDTLHQQKKVVRFHIDGVQSEELCGYCKGLAYEPVVRATDGVIYCNECAIAEHISTFSLPYLRLFGKDRLVQCSNCSHSCRIGMNLEGLASHIAFQCRFQCINFGCSEALPLDKLKDHLTQCSKSVIDCPYADYLEQHSLTQNIPHPCTFKGIRGMMENHLTKSRCLEFLDVVKYFETAEIKTSAPMEIMPVPPVVAAEQDPDPDPNSLKITYLKYNDYSIRLIRTESGGWFVRWTDLASPVIPSDSDKSRELQNLVDSSEVKSFSIWVEGRRVRGNNVTEAGITQWLANRRKPDWNESHPYQIWIREVLLPAMQNPSAKQTSLKRQRTSVDPVTPRITSTTSISTSTPALKRIATIVERILQQTYDNPETRNDPIGKTRGQLIQYVWNRLGAEEKEVWRRFESSDPKECSKDFSRAVTKSPYKTFGELAQCKFRF